MLRSVDRYILTLFMNCCPCVNRKKRKARENTHTIHNMVIGRLLLSTTYEFVARLNVTMNSSKEMELKK